MLLRTFILSVFFSITTSLWSQGPISGFRATKGEVVIATGYSTESYDRYFLREGEESRDLSVDSYSLFVEAATGSRTSIIATLPYININKENRGLQDGSLWIKYLNSQTKAKKGLHNVFTAIGLTTPVSNYKSGTAQSIGGRSTVFNGRLAYQYQHNSGFFANVVSGIDFQIAPESLVSIPLLLRSGYGGSFFYVEGWFEMVRALEDNTTNSSAVAGTGSSWNRFGATLYVPVTKWLGLNAGGAWITSGKFIGASSRYNVGAVFKIQTKK